MKLSASKTSFARLSPAAARIVLLAVAGAVALSVGVSLSPLGKGFADKPSRGPGDVALYRAAIDRIHAGEGYYQAMGAELRGRGYPTRSVFNWRTPLPIALIGVLPEAVLGKALLGILALLALLCCFELLAREAGPTVAVIGGLLMCGGMLPCLLGDLYVMPVLWAGVLLVLSLALLGLGRTRAGVTAGVAALFCRELAGPYVALSLVLALVQRRYREAAWWAAGLLAYAAFFSWHVAQVNALHTAADTAHRHGWIQLGGLAFVVSVTQMNGWLLVLPQWLAAIYLPLALLGFAGWQGPAGQRVGLVAACFVLLFGFVGQDFNQYWGSLIAPLLCLGAAWTPVAIRDLWQSARGCGVTQLSSGVPAV